MKISRAAVCGGGTMGAGIAHVLALSGLEVALIEATPGLASRALGVIAKNLDRQVLKAAISAEQKAAALARISAAAELSAAAAAQIVIEAVPERLELKTELFRKLDAACGAGTILASNTSSLPIGRLAAVTKRRDRVIGMHFMNPVPLMKLVEIIRTDDTSKETYETARELTLALGKTPVVSRDLPGFISNRILMPMINEACFALQDELASARDIDTVMKLGMNHPMGPLELADHIGLDVCLDIMRVLHEGFKDDKYRPCPLLQKLVAAGKLGKKTGAGFYDYVRA